MKTQAEIVRQPKLEISNTGADGGAAYWNPTKSTKPAVIVWSFGGGWDHVSVSFRHRCPTWDEMCAVKDMFFGDDETVIQYHPAKSNYVNRHPYCLHLWRPQGKDLPLPPVIFV